MYLRDMKQSDLDFVVRHYRRGALSAKEAWQQLDIPDRKPRLLRIFGGRRAAAAACVAAVLTASAFIGYHFVGGSAAPVTVQTSASTRQTPAATAVQPRLTFTDAPLSQVVATIERTYGVKVSGLGDDGDRRLTLSYQGSASDLIHTINELLGTKLAIA